MKHYFIIFFLINIFFTVSCQTTKKNQSNATNVNSEEVAVADFISDDIASPKTQDLESEFLSSEKFEEEQQQKQETENRLKQEELKDDEMLSDANKDDEMLSDTKEEELKDEELKDDEMLSDANKDDEMLSDTKEEELKDDEMLLEDDESEILSQEDSNKNNVKSDDPETTASNDNTTNSDIDSNIDSETTQTEETTSPNNDNVVINSIRYESTENKIYVDAVGTILYQLRENKNSNQFVIEISQAILADSLKQRPFIMKDFNKQIVLLQADQKDNNTVRIVVQMKDNYSMPSILVSDSGSLVISPIMGFSSSADTILAESSSSDTIKRIGGVSADSLNSHKNTVKVLPATSLEEFFMHTPTFTGRPISIHLEDISVRDVLYFISEDTGLNMVLADDVRGNISIKLRNVPWDQALVIVMKTKKLGYIREGNVIRIMSLEALKQNQISIKKIIEDQKILEPLKIKVIPVIYTQVNDIQKQIETLLTKERGKVIIDIQSNSLIVTDSERVIKRIEVMVKHLDRVPKQIMIEAKVVETTEDIGNILGITWSFTGAPLNITPLGNPQLALNVDGNIIGFPSLRTGNDTVSGRTLGGGLNIGFAPVGSLDINLGLSEAEGRANIISAPRIMVLNGEKAKITQSYESISVSTKQSEQGASLGTEATRDEAKLEFEVSPQITSIGAVFLDIKLQREFFGAEAEPSTGAHPKHSRNTETKVLVQNGQTVVIGGIYHHTNTKSNEGIPLLKHIPILKMLFSRVTKSDKRVELLLFLTPRVLNFASAAE